ncbi:MAG: hypothetical protein ACI4JN_04020 [Ruminococcus sp.]
MNDKEFENYQFKLSESLQDTLNIIDKFRQEMTENIVKAVVPVLTEFTDNIKKCFSSLNLINIDKDAFVDNLSKWGEYGWTMLDFASFDLYCGTVPSTCEEADKKVLLYCTYENIKMLIESILGSTAKTQDFKDAIFCYENRRWKPCAMVLLGIIDAMLIKSQPKSSEWRKVGDKAALILKGKITEENTKKTHFITFGHHLATLKAIITIYASGNDFSNENPSVISRAFVDHGMSQRDVTKTDCIKLLAIIDNLIAIYDYYGFSFQS